MGEVVWLVKGGDGLYFCDDGDVTCWKSARLAACRFMSPTEARRVATGYRHSHGARVVRLRRRA